MLTPWRNETFQSFYDHSLSHAARDNAGGKDVFVYLCKLSGYYGIGHFLDHDPGEVWPGCGRDVRVFKELVSLGTNLAAVGPEKLIELRQRLAFDPKKAMATIREHEARRPEAIQARADEDQKIRQWLCQETGKEGPTSLWSRNKTRFSFAGKGGSKASTTIVAPSFGSLEE